jgi:RimJ/RimL family protein N-acetyltransferase
MKRQGSGSIAVAAALEDGFQRALREVNWRCDAGNPGSVRTAEKLGLERIGDYQMGILLFNEEHHKPNKVKPVEISHPLRINEILCAKT